MGKRTQGAALRAKKRAVAAQEELTDQVAQHVESRGVADKPNEELFVLDTTARPVPLPKVATNKKKIAKQDPGVYEKEQRKMKALMKKHGNDPKALRALVAAGKKPKRPSRKADTSFDLWAEDDQEIDAVSNKLTPAVGASLAGTAPAFTQTKAQPVTRKLREPTIAVEVAHSGQSYHPDTQKHQDIIGEALSLELRRKEAQHYKETPISTGLKAETKALMVGDDESSEEENDVEDDDKEETVVTKKKIKKLTRAQRNKQKRLRAEEKEIQERRRAKKALNAVHDVKRMQKELKQKELEKKERKEWISQVKQQDQRKLGKGTFQERSRVDPIGAPTFPVALTEELQSSLRTIKPKGSLLTDRMESFRDRKMADKKRTGDRKKVVQGNKRRRLKVKAKGHDIKVTDESGRDYLLMG